MGTKKRKDTPPELFHLYALKHLCDLAALQGYDTEWIYRAFENETKPKSKTVLQSYYLGGFIAALIECGCNKAQAFAETVYWLGCSQTKAENAFNNYMKLRSGYSPLDFSILIRSQKLKAASTFINSISKPFPEGKKGNKMAEKAYKALETKIQQHGHNKEPALEIITQKFSG